MLDDHSKNNLNVKTDRNEYLLVRLKCNAVSSGNGYWEFGSGQPESPGGSQAGLQEDRRPPGCYRGWDGEWWQWGSHQQVTLAALRALYLMHTLGELLHVFKWVKKEIEKERRHYLDECTVHWAFGDSNQRASLSLSHLLFTLS